MTHFRFVKSKNICLKLLHLNEITADKEIQLTSSDWSTFSPELDFDLILASECTYSESSYEKFHQVLEQNSSKNSKTKILISMKNHYFGPGGSLKSWENFVKLKGIFSFEVVEKIDGCLPRFVVLMEKI